MRAWRLRLRRSVRASVGRCHARASLETPGVAHAAVPRMPLPRRTSSQIPHIRPGNTQAYCGFGSSATFTPVTQYSVSPKHELGIHLCWS